MPLTLRWHNGQHIPYSLQKKSYGRLKKYHFIQIILGIPYFWALLTISLQHLQSVSHDTSWCCFVIFADLPFYFPAQGLLMRLMVDMGCFQHILEACQTRKGLPWVPMHMLDQLKNENPNETNPPPIMDMLVSWQLSCCIVEQICICLSGKGPRLTLCQVLTNPHRPAHTKTNQYS